MLWFVLASWIAYLFFLSKTAPINPHSVSQRLMSYDYRRWLCILQRRTQEASNIPGDAHKLHHYYILSPKQLMRHKR